MKRLLMTAMLMLMVGVPNAWADPVTETVQMQYLTPPGVLDHIRIPEGVDSITIHPANNSVSLSGTAEAVSTLAAQIKKLDVSPIQYQLAPRLVHYQVTREGKYSENVVVAPLVTTTDKTSAAVSVTTPQTGGYQVILAPTRRDDGTLELIGEIRELGAQGNIVCSGRNWVQTIVGEATRVVGMTDATDTALRRRVIQGEVVRDQGAYTGWYLEVTTTEVEKKGR